MTYVNPRQKWRGTLEQAETTVGMEGVIGYLTDVQELVYFKSDTMGDFVRIAASSLFNLPADLEDWERRHILDKLLLPATKDKLGGIRAGNGIGINNDGTIKVVDLDKILSPATDDKLGGVKIGQGLSITEDGVAYISDNIDYVVETWRAADGKAWYRKYKSGWVEQGGILLTSDGMGNRAVTLPVPMADALYHKQKTLKGGASNGGGFNWVYVADADSGTVDTTTVAWFSVQGGAYTVGIYWEVKGMGA